MFDRNRRADNSQESQQSCGTPPARLSRISSDNNPLRQPHPGSDSRKSVSADCVEEARGEVTGSRGHQEVKVKAGEVRLAVSEHGAVGGRMTSSFRHGRRSRNHRRRHPVTSSKPPPPQSHVTESPAVTSSGTPHTVTSSSGNHPPGTPQCAVTSSAPEPRGRAASKHGSHPAYHRRAESPGMTSSGRPPGMTSSERPPQETATRESRTSINQCPVFLHSGSGRLEIHRY